MDIKPTILGSGIQGIQRGLNSAREQAQEIASGHDASLSGLTEPLIGLKQSLVQVQASAEVVATVDTLLDFLLRDTDR